MNSSAVVNQKLTVFDIACVSVGRETEERAHSPLLMSTLSAFSRGKIPLSLVSHRRTKNRHGR